MERLYFIKDIKKSNLPCPSFEGTKKYIATGDIENNAIISYEEVSYKTKPSRANVCVSNGDVLFAKMQNTIKVIQIDSSNNNNIYSTGFYCFRDERILPSFLKHFFLTKRFNEQKDKRSNGATMKAINDDGMSELSIPFYPLEKQQEIVSILDKINEIIDADKKQLELLDESVKSRFIEMFDSIEKKVPLKEICSIAGGYSFKSTDICSDGIKLLQIGNVALNDLDWSTTNYLPVGFEKQRPNFLLKEDDIVVALTRPIIQSLGNVKVCIVKQEDLPCLLNQRVGKIQCIDGKSVVNYIFGCLMTEDFTEYVKSCCTGCSQPNISTKDIESYQVPNVNIESQLAFSNFKDLIDKLKFNVQQHLDLMQELLDKKMEEFFGGE